MKSNEIWKDVVGYEGLYQVSNIGRIKSLLFNKEVILKTRLNKKGYEMVNLKGKTYRVHTLVAKAFIQNPYNLPEINHEDENKLNNKVENLKWCDRKYNCNYGSLPNKVAKRFQKKIVMFNNNGTKKYFDSSMDAERQIGIDHSSIIKCCKGKVKTAGGYRWEYAN